MNRYLFVVVVLFSMILSSCTGKVDLGKGYEWKSKDFLQAMRWKDFQGAAAYLRSENRPQLLTSFEESEDLHIVDAEYQYSRLNRTLGTAESELVLKYYLLPSTRVQTWRWKIDWLLIPADTKQRGTWQVQGGPPTFP